MGYKLNDKLDFGKYKGFTIEEVYTGWAYPTQNFILDFFKYRFSDLSNFEFFDSKNKSYKLTVNEFEILTDNEMKIVCKSNTGSLPKSLITDLNIALSSAEERPHRFIFDNANDFILKQREDFSKNYKVFADPGYILWGIKDHSDFYLDNSELAKIKDKDINIFSGITLNLIHDNFYNYNIRISKSRRRIPDEIITVNYQKSQHR